jgi:hypothetical protein
MNTTQHAERRRHVRLPVRSEIVGHELPLLGAGEDETPIEGHVEDMSRGGLCIETARPLRVSFPVRCELPFPGSHVPVPIVLKVQWSRQLSPGSSRYRSGLQFLL